MDVLQNIALMCVMRVLNTSALSIRSGTAVQRWTVMQEDVQNNQKQVSADRPTRRSDSCLRFCTQMSTVSVINWWPRPSPVYHTDRPTNLTAPETISRSRDMVGAHQNSNGLRDLTTPLSWMVCHPWTITCCRQPTYQIWDVYLHAQSLWRYERRCKMSKMGWFGVVKVTQGHWKSTIR